MCYGDTNMGFKICTYQTVDRSKPSVYIGRPSPLGNPFKLKDPNNDLEREDVIRKYARWLADRIDARDPHTLDALNGLLALRKKFPEVQLICYCAPKPCHGDILARAVERAIARGM